MIQIICPVCRVSYTSINGLHRRSDMPKSWKFGLAALGLVLAAGYAVAQMPSGDGNDGKGPMQGDHHVTQEMMRRMLGSGQPTMPGQGAFGAIQEIVGILEADANTDWSKVNINALREHLIDMNEVTFKAVANEHKLDNGLEIAVTGEGRTLDAIKRMVPAHARELVKNGWSTTTEDLPNGVKFTVTSTDPQLIIKIKGLGFMGIMVHGGHHQLHHLAMAKGEFGAHQH